MFIIAVYVGDIVLAGREDRGMVEVKNTLFIHFEIKNRANYTFCGDEGHSGQKTRNIWIGQPAYAERVLQNFGMEHTKLFNTPIDPSTKLQMTEDVNIIDQGLCQSAVSSLLYLSV